MRGNHHKQGAHRQGLTTAAGLWAVALIGLVVGAGYWAVGVLAAALVYFAMVVLRKVESRRLKFQENVMLLISAEQHPSIIGDISSVLASAGIAIQMLTVDEKADGLVLRIQVRMNQTVRPDLLMEQIDEIVGVNSVTVLDE